MLQKVVQSSITTSKCSEDSYYGVRIRVSKSSDLPFSSYGPRPFFGPAILAENYNYIQFVSVRCRFLCLLVPEIDYIHLYKLTTKGNRYMLTRKKSAMEDFRVLPYSKIVAASRYQPSRVVSYLSTFLGTRVVAVLNKVVSAQSPL